jgi:hypothetical protein
MLPTARKLLCDDMTSVGTGVHIVITRIGKVVHIFPARHTLSVCIPNQFACSFPDCMFRANQKGGLQRHIDSQQ